MALAVDPWTVAAACLAVGVAVWGIRLLKSRLDEQRYQEELSAMEFEQSLLSSHFSSAASGDDARFLQSTQAAANAIPQPSAPLFSSSSAAATETTLAGAQAGPQDMRQAPADVQAKAVVDKLRTAGLLRHIDGYLELHGNAQGVAILKLRNGQTALLVPHLESEAFLQRNERRADMIIIALPNGQSYVVRPLGAMIADSITS